MNITEKAMENYKKLFPELVGKENLDEELMEIILNFSLDEAQEYDKLDVDVKTRELITFSILLSQGGYEPQLKGHIAGNVNVGNDKQTLLNTVTALLPYVGYPRSLNAIACINQVIPD